MAADLSVVIPAYDEARRLGPTLDRIAAYLGERGVVHEIVVELAWLARRRGFRVEEVGVSWADSADSRAHPVRDSAAMLRDVLRVRLRHRRRGR